MFEGFGPEKMIFLMIVLLLVFGAKRIPEIGAGLGKGIREFKKSMNDIGKEEADSQAPQLSPPQHSQTAAPQLPDKTEAQ